MSAALVLCSWLAAQEAPPAGVHITRHPWQEVSRERARQVLKASGLVVMGVAGNMIVVSVHAMAAATALKLAPLPIPETRPGEETVAVNWQRGGMVSNLIMLAGLLLVAGHGVLLTGVCTFLAGFWW